MLQKLGASDYAEVSLDDHTRCVALSDAVMTTLWWAMPFLALVAAAALGWIDGRYYAKKENDSDKPGSTPCAPPAP